MKTQFLPGQLIDPQLADSDRILRRCVRCGFCTATCPTYLLTGEELDSPRGRIQLARNMLESECPPDAKTVRHLDRCLTCLACMTTCPSGVHYMHLIDHARQHIERTYRRPLPERCMRWALARVLPYPTRFAWALKAARLARRFRLLLPNALRAMIDAAGNAHATSSDRSSQSTPLDVPSPAVPSRRIALLRGCVQPVLRPQINAAAIRLLRRLGAQVVLAEGVGCCGALTHHLGQERQTYAHASADIEAWMREHDSAKLDAIAVTASGCGTMLKDYGHIFRGDPHLASRAKCVSGLTRDITEILAELEWPASMRAPQPDLRVAYHSACSLQHGQGLRAIGAGLLLRAGFTVVDVPEGHLCCGSAGTYSLLQPQMSKRLRERKVRNLESARPAVIATDNIGCITQIAQATRIPVLHTVELLDWAAGGVRPGALQQTPTGVFE